jgi:hypothetical protein
MYFALLIRTDPELMAEMEPADFVALAADVEAFDQELTRADANLGSVRLGPASDTKVIRLRGGKPFTTAGPFAETAEQIGGIYLIEADDLDAAVAIAEKLASTRVGSTELRAVLGVDLRRIVLHEADV